MKTYFSLLVTLIMSVFTPITSFAQPYSLFSQVPMVPISEITGGRQRTTDNLLGQSDYVHLSYGGPSVMNATTWMMPVSSLPGYSTDKGSFTQIKAGLEKLDAFRTRLITVGTNDEYKVSLGVSLVNRDGQILLDGGIDASYTGFGGKLDSMILEPSLWIAPYLAFEVKGFANARWIGGADDFEDLMSEYNQATDRTRFVFPERRLDSGKLAINQSAGGVYAYGMNGEPTEYGVDALVSIRNLSAGDIFVPKDASNILSAQVFFYRGENSDVFYGRYPLIDIVIPEGYKSHAEWLSVPVWGSDLSLLPIRIYADSLNQNQKGGPQSFEIRFSPEAGGWIFNLPPGAYHIFVEFSPEALKDPNSDPNPPKG